MGPGERFGILQGFVCTGGEYGPEALQQVILVPSSLFEGRLLCASRARDSTWHTARARELFGKWRNK